MLIWDGKNPATLCVHVTENSQTSLQENDHQHRGYITTYVTPLVTLALSTGSQHTTVAVNARLYYRKEPCITFGKLLLLLLLYVASLPVILGETPRSAGTSNHIGRSYNHQNKLGGIRICPVTAPFNKRIRKSTESGLCTEHHSKSPSQSFVNELRK